MNRICRCNDVCLAVLGPDDDVVFTETGYVLVEHVADPYPQEVLPLDLGCAS